MGHFDEADTQVEECVRLVGDFGDFGREAYKITATRAYIDSYRDAPDSPWQLLNELEQQIDQISENIILAKFCFPLMSSIYLRLNDFERARVCLARWESIGMYPVAKPQYLLFLGDCEAGLGHKDVAKSAYENATALGIETIHAQIARDRLTNLAQPVS